MTKKGEVRQFFLDVVCKYEGDECLTWPYSKRDGYGIIWWNGKLQTTSRLLCERTYGAPPTLRHEAAHSCGRGHLGCVTKRHMSWKTGAANLADREKHGTVPAGERHGRSKLTAKEVSQIRALKGVLLPKEISPMYGVTTRQVQHILSGKSWAHSTERKAAA